MEIRATIANFPGSASGFARRRKKLQQEDAIPVSAGKRRIPTNLRLVQLIELLGLRAGPVTAAEIARETGLPKATVHRLANTLEKEGLVVRERNGAGLRPARRLRSIGFGLLFGSWDRIARHQVLLRIAASAEETVNFSIPEETGMRYVDRVETDWPIRVQLPVGTNVPFYCTAGGKAFMASLPPPERRRFVECLDLKRLSANTIVDSDALLENLREVERRGYAIDNEEFLDGMNAISVPVKDGEGRYFASLAIHGPKQRLTVEAAVSKAGILLEGAGALRDVVLRGNI